MKIEAGKYYKTRDGRKAYIAGISPKDSNRAYPFIGVIYYHSVHGAGGPESWDYKGTRFSGYEGDCEHYAEADLVAEWKEPARGTVWVNVNMAPRSIPYPHSISDSREDADEMALDTRIACIEVPWVEGQGL